MKKLIWFLLTIPVLASTDNLHAQGTAFTYQGRLNANGNPGNGNYDLTFALFNNASTNTGQVGATLTNLGVGVTNGLFTVMLDFGANFPGTSRWLAIGVRTNGGGAFTALHPLQPLTPTPYAITAGGASNLLGTVAAAQLTGTIPLAQLPGAVITNNDASSVSLTGAFAGNGAGLTNLALNALNSGGTLGLASNGNTFVSAGTIVVGNEPYFLTIASNLNGLGRVDMVVANAGDGTLTILTNNGQGQFGVEATPQVGVVPDAVAVADVNHDGKPDLICANYNDGTLTVLTNSGSGFISNAILTVGPQPLSVAAVTNLNGLGNVDLVSANSGTNTLTVWTNNGAGKFLLKGTLTVGPKPVSVVAGDLTHQGRPDLISANDGTNTLTVLINIGGGAFVPVTYVVGNGPSAVAAVDVNGDGWLDLVCANETDGTLSVLTNNGTGDGTLTLASTVTMPLGVQTFAVADLNGDGKPDLICANIDQGLQVALNTGNGTYSFNCILEPPGPDSAAVFNGLVAADINGDGRVDLVTADFNSNYLAVLLNETGAPSVELTAASQTGGLRVAPGFLGVPNLINGSAFNLIGPGVDGSVIAGGGSATAINQILASDSAIGGGTSNTVQFVANYSSIGGGFQNTTDGEYAFIGAGQQNTAQGSSSVVGGGDTNSALATESFIGGGALNTASANGAVIGGGTSNSILGQNAVIVGGAQNVNNAPNGFVGAGQQNNQNGQGGVIAGGMGNVVNASYGTVGGGMSNNINGSGAYDTVAGGQNNKAGGLYSSVGGGWSNQATQPGAVVGGGGYDGTSSIGNVASGVASVIGGGLGNQNSGNYGTIGGGYLNTNQGVYTTISGGYENNVGGFYTTISGGYRNLSGALYATIPGGYENVVGASYAMAAGQQAQALHQGAFVWADSQNSVFQSTANNQFNVRANGGARFVTSGSGMTLDGPISATSFSGNANGLTNLPAGNLAGTLPSAVLPANVALLSGNQTFTNADTFSNSLTINTGSGTVQIQGDQGAVPGIIVSGGAASGHLRFRNALELWPNTALTTGGYLDLRSTNSSGNAITISLTGSTGAIVCSNVTASGVLLTSDRNAKQNFTSLDPKETLMKVSNLPVTQWNYKTDPPATKHLGPMAQDFHAAFGLNGADDTHISVIDESGVALAAIQGLNQKLNERVAELQNLERQNELLAERLNELEASVKKLAAQK